MLYLDYSRREGEWLPNPHGGRENLDALRFLRELNRAVREEAPGAITVAEESTAWPGVTRPVEEGGLGFHFKWNMGWMHDTLGFLARDPVHRGHHQDEFTFAMLYEYSERFVNPLSHDEVVHGKGSLLQRMPGDAWQKLANLRLLLAYQWTRPGKKLLFMGSELAPTSEWSHDQSLDWHLAEDPAHRAFGVFVEALGRLYADSPSLWRRDPDPEGFAWIDCSDRQHSVVSYQRRDGDDHLLAVLNLTPVPRLAYRIGVPRAGRYAQRLNSDELRFGGSGHPTRERALSEPAPWHGHPQSVVLDLPPLAALVLVPET
jgi:1,4-alpha-glucan branching enzyme